MLTDSTPPPEPESLQSLKTQDNVVQVGILHSLTGTMALSETPLVDGTLMAIAQINQTGGVLGQMIVPIIEDGESESATFAQKARKLIEDDQVATVFGCWTSATRKAVLPIFEEQNALLWYPVQYEGLECSKNIFYTGSCPNQQVEPAVTWLLQNKGKRFYLLGSDYVFPRTVNKVVKAQLKQQGGTVVGEKYIPLDIQNFAEAKALLKNAIAHIQQAKPDVIFSTLNGNSNITFYRQYTDAGILAEDIPILAVSVAEAELQQIGDAAVGHYASWTYFQSLDTPQNQYFVEKFQAMYGTGRVTSDPIEAAYTQVYLWKQAVELAQSFEVDRVRVAAYGQIFEAPSGLVKVESNHHLWKECHIGKILPTGQFEIVFSSDSLIKPLPWLGVEELNFSAREVVINLLAEVSNGVQYSWQLEQQSQELAATMTQLQAEMAERQRAEEERKLLLTITEAISKAPNFHCALEVALCQVCEATGWNYGEAWIPSTDETILECSPAWYCSRTDQDENAIASLEHFRVQTTRMTFQIDEGLPGRVSNCGQPEWIADISAESDDIFLRAKLAKECGLKAGFGVPIVINQGFEVTINSSLTPQTSQRVLAVLVFFMSESCQQDERLVELVSAVAAQLGTLMQQKQAEAQSYQRNQEMLSYIHQVEKFTAAAVAVENGSFELESLDEVVGRGDKLGQLARVFKQMVQTIKAREEELAEAKAQLEAILNAVPGAISWIDSDGSYIGVNRHLAKTWNLSPEAFIGKEIGFLKGNTQFAEFARQFLASSEESTSQVIAIQLTNSVKYYLVAAQKYQQGTATVSVGIDVTKRKLAEEALKQSEERFRSLISNIPGAIYRCQHDRDWTMEFLSDFIEEISGYPAEDFIHNQSRSYASIIHPDDRILVEVVVDHALIIQEPFILEYRIRHRDGSIRWVYEKGRAVFDEEDNPLYIDGAIFDITERQQSEQALRQSEATNRALIAAIPDLMIRAKRDGTYLDIVGRDRLSVQNSPQFSISSSVYDSLPLAQAQQRMYYIQQALQTGKVQVYEQRFTTDGQPQDEEVRIVVSGEDEVLIMVRDITDRKRAEEALRIAEENYRSIFENALEGIFQSTPDGNYISVNPAMARIHGYESPDEMMASVTQIEHQVYVDSSCRDEFRRLMEKHGRVNAFEYQVRKPDGSMIWVEENTRAVRDNRGELLYYEGIIQDITQRKRQEEDLKRQLQQLRIEIDQQKRKQEVAQITQSSYFQELQAEVEHMRFDDEDDL